MGPSHVKFGATIVVITIIALTPCKADNEAKEFLDIHNKARVEVGVPPVTWNATLESYAKAYAVRRSYDCLLEHSNGPYGENVVMCPCDMSVAVAVKSWTDEKANYDYKANKCVGSGMCRHYTAMVCRRTTSIGCARVKCKKHGSFATCNYWPRDDWAQRPY